MDTCVSSVQCSRLLFSSLLFLFLHSFRSCVCESVYLCGYRWMLSFNQWSLVSVVLLCMKYNFECNVSDLYFFIYSSLLLIALHYMDILLSLSLSLSLVFVFVSVFIICLCNKIFFQFFLYLHCFLFFIFILYIFWIIIIYFSTYYYYHNNST